MPKRLDLTQINRLNNQNIFLDTNILIYVFCPISNTNPTFVTNYSKAFNYLIQSNNKLYIDFAVLSEFINRYVQIAFKIHSSKNESPKGAPVAGNGRDRSLRASPGPKEFEFKKDYKKTEDFKETLNLISSAINKILNKTIFTNFSYSNQDVRDLINNYKNQLIDVNDLHIIKLCKLNNYLLLTNDSDYKNADIDIISGNPKLLKLV